MSHPRVSLLASAYLHFRVHVRSFTIKCVCSCHCHIYRGNQCPSTKREMWKEKEVNMVHGFMSGYVLFISKATKRNQARRKHEFSRRLRRKARRVSDLHESTGGDAYHEVTKVHKAFPRVSAHSNDCFHFCSQKGNVHELDTTFPQKVQFQHLQNRCPITCMLLAFAWVPPQQYSWGQRLRPWKSPQTYLRMDQTASKASWSVFVPLSSQLTLCQVPICF